MEIAPAASTSPSAATKEQSPDEVAVVADVAPAFVCVLAADSPRDESVRLAETAATTVLRPIVRPIVRTTKAVRTTVASGEASLRSSRYDIESVNRYIVK